MHNIVYQFDQIQSAGIGTDLFRTVFLHEGEDAKVTFFDIFLLGDLVSVDFPHYLLFSLWIVFHKIGPISLISGGGRQL